MLNRVFYSNHSLYYVLEFFDEKSTVNVCSFLLVEYERQFACAGCLLATRRRHFSCPAQWPTNPPVARSSHGGSFLGKLIQKLTYLASVVSDGIIYILPCAALHSLNKPLRWVDHNGAYYKQHYQKNRSFHIFSDLLSQSEKILYKKKDQNQIDKICLC